VRAGISASEETLVELLHVSFSGLWVACEFDDSQQSASDKSLEDAWGVCRGPWEIKIQVQIFFKERGGDSTLFDGEGDVEVVDTGGWFTDDPLEMVELEAL